MARARSKSTGAFKSSINTRQTNVNSFKKPENSDDVAAAFHVVLINPPDVLQYRAFPLLEKVVTLGRSSRCDIVIDRTEISKKHATLTRQGLSWVLEDLGSTNGTLVEGAKIRQCTLTSGMHFQLAHCEFVLLERDHPELVRFQRYYQDQRQDQLTALPNSRAFEETLGSLGRDTASSVTVALLEVDDFQKINKELGQALGDQTLRAVAAKLVHRVREGEVFRMSGGRFAALWFEVLDDPEQHVQALVEGVARGIVAAGGTHPITLSGGLTTFEGSANAKVSLVLSSAGRALTRAQRRGGGRVESESLALVESSLAPGEMTSLEVRIPTAVYFRHSLSTFKETLPRGALLFAVEIADRQLVAVTDQRQFERLERALDVAVREVVLATHGSCDLVVGEGLNGHPILVGASSASSLLVASICSEIEKRFLERCARESIDGRLVTSRAVRVESTSDAIAQALRGLDRTGPHRSFLPLPIGHASRLVEDARTSEQQFFALNRLQQAIARWLFSVVAAEAVRLAGEFIAPVKRLEQVLQQPVSERAWVKLLEAYVDALRPVPPERLVVPAYMEVLTTQDGIVLRELEQFSTIRNQFAHGHDVQSKGFVDEWKPRLKSLLTGPLSSLGDCAVRYVVRVDNLDEDSFDVHFKNLMGDNLAAETTVERRDRPLPDARIMVMGPNSGLSLSPFAMYLRCPKCHIEEVFLLDRLQRGPSFRSLREGAHAIQRLSEAGLDPRYAERVMDALDRALVAL